MKCVSSCLLDSFVSLYRTVSLACEWINPKMRYTHARVYARVIDDWYRSVIGIIRRPCSSFIRCFLYKVPDKIVYSCEQKVRGLYRVKISTKWEVQINFVYAIKLKTNLLLYIFLDLSSCKYTSLNLSLNVYYTAFYYAAVTYIDTSIFNISLH